MEQGPRYRRVSTGRVTATDERAGAAGAGDGRGAGAAP